MKTAFKEWGVVCRALSRGDQVLILRKGGIIEEGGEFRIDHPAFLLFPTYLHQSPQNVVPLARPWLEEIETNLHKEETVRISHVAKVVDTRRVLSMASVERLRGEHIWSDDVVAERFHRWRDSIYALVVRISALPSPVTLELRKDYGGCKSWVELAEDVSIAGATPVLDDEVFESRATAVRTALDFS